jgi:hypothetical protein
MSKIGILDDRPGEIATATSIISRNLNDSKWSVVKVPLLATPARVVEWLAHEGVNVLVADQVLNDDANHQQVKYQGTDVVNEVRRHIPDLPVYMLTAFPKNPDVAPNLPRIEEMVLRGELGKRASVLVPRMMRAGETFERRHRELLSRLSELSQKKATDLLTKSEEKELKSLQMSLALADTSASREKLLPELEREVKKLADLQAKAEELLRKARHKK